MQVPGVPPYSSRPGLSRASGRALLAGACCLALLTTACVKGPPAGTPQLGRITVGVSTTGSELTIESLAFRVDIQPPGSRAGIRADAGVYDEDVPAGDYRVRLSGVPGHCRVNGPSERRVVVSARRTTAVRFSVACRDR